MMAKTHSLKPLAEVVWDAFHHTSVGLNSNTSWCDPDKGTEKVTKAVHKSEHRWTVDAGVNSDESQLSICDPITRDAF